MKFFRPGQNLIEFTSIANPTSLFEIYIDDRKVNALYGSYKLNFDTVKTTNIKIKLKSDSSIVLEENISNQVKPNDSSSQTIRQHWIHVQNELVLKRNRINKLKFWNYDPTIHYFKVSNATEISFEDHILQIRPFNTGIVQIEIFEKKTDYGLSSFQYLVE